MDGWHKIGKSSELLNVHRRTLYNWEEKGLIEVKRTNGKTRLFNVKKYLLDNGFVNQDNTLNLDIPNINKNTKDLKICYTRVSSHSQKDDLERQIKYMKQKYPNHLIFKDIGSGINLNRRCLRKIIDLAIEGRVKEVVVAYKDRLARFGFELIKNIIKCYSNRKIVIINKSKKEEPEEELVKDLLQIMNIFTAKMNGLRKYSKLS